MWEQEEEEALEAELKKKLEKSLRKKIVKREKNYNYDLDDSDENPYSEDVSCATVYAFHCLTG